MLLYHYGPELAPQFTADLEELTEQCTALITNSDDCRRQEQAIDAQLLAPPRGDQPPLLDTIDDRLLKGIQEGRIPITDLLLDQQRLAVASLRQRATFARLQHRDLPARNQAVETFAKRYGIGGAAHKAGLWIVAQHVSSESGREHWPEMRHSNSAPHNGSTVWQRRVVRGVATNVDTTSGEPVLILKPRRGRFMPTEINYQIPATDQDVRIVSARRYVLRWNRW